MSTSGASTGRSATATSTRSPSRTQARSAGRTILSPCSARMALDSSTNCSSWLALRNSIDGTPMSTPDAASMTLATRPAVSTVSTTPSRSAAAIIGNASWILVPPRMNTQGRAGSSRRRARLAYSLLEQPAHGRRQQLLEADQGGLGAVRGGKGVADVEVGERRQLAHHQRLGLVLGRELELALEQRELLAAEAHVVEEQDLAVREPADRVARGRPADVVDEPHVAAGELAHHRGVGLGRGVVVVLEVAALVGEQDDARAGLRELADGRRAALEPRDVAQPARLRVERRVDVHAAEDDLAAPLEVVERVDAVLHGSVRRSRRPAHPGRGTGWSGRRPRGGRSAG